MTEMVPSGLMRGHWRRSDGDAYTGTKLETAETAKVHLHTTAPVLYSTGLRIRASVRCGTVPPGLRTYGQTSSNGRMTGCRVRQLEPRTTQEVAPVQPVALAASAQHSNPLQLHLAPNVVEFWLTVMQSEVLVEATQHRRQLTLLVPSLP